MKKQELILKETYRYEKIIAQELRDVARAVYNSLDTDEDIKESYVKVNPPKIEQKYSHITDLLPEKAINKKAEKSSEIKTNKLVKTESAMSFLQGQDIFFNNKKNTIADIFIENVKKNPNCGITYYDEEGESERNTYAQIYAQSKTILANLNEFGIKKSDKLIFQCGTGKDYIDIFWACMFGGIIPIPLDVMRELDVSTVAATQLKNIWSLLEKPYIVISSNLVEDYTLICTELGIDSSYLLNIDRLRVNTSLTSRITPLKPDDTGLIFFTSGSTGTPKGVTQTNRAVIMQVMGSIKFFNYRQDVSLNWMPLEHVGGILMAHVRGVMLGSEQIQVDKGYILSNPIRWLDLIDKHRVVHTWSPHFAYALINEKLIKMEYFPWDFSSVEYMLNGGEMIDAVGAKKFMKLLGKCNMRPDIIKPVWGMAETCSGTIYNNEFTIKEATGVQRIKKNLDENGRVIFVDNEVDSRSITEVGTPIPGISIRIVNNQNEIIPENTIGALQIKGHAITKGYFNNEEANSTSFTKDGWFVTGDLAFIHNGKIVLTGREKDVIIINGLNYNSVEIESLIEEIPSVLTSYTAVCAVRDYNNNTDRVIAFYVPSDEIDIYNVRKQILSLVQKKMNLTLDYIIPVSEGEIPKTNLNKIQRLKLVSRFLNGDFDTIIKQIDLKLGNENTIPNWFFTKAWYPNLLPSFSVNKSKSYLIFADKANQALLLAERLPKSIYVSMDNEYKKTNSGYCADYSVFNSIASVFQDLILNGVKVDSIIYCGSITENVKSVEELNNIQKYAFGGLVNIAKFLAKNFEPFHQLFIVTQTLHPIIKDELVNYAIGNIEGLYKCLNEEVSTLDCCHIDIDSFANVQTLHSVVEELQLECIADMMVSFRKGVRYACYLDQVNVLDKTKQSNGFIKGGLYMITGGLSGVGLELAKYLLVYYNAKLIIIGRTNLNDHDIASKKKKMNLDALLNLSNDVYYYCCNVSDSSKMENIISICEADFGQKIDGILHSAGIGNLTDHWKDNEKKWVKNINQYDIYQMNQAKIYGTYALYQIAKKRKNMTLILFSSTNSFFGSVSFAAYSSANSFVNYIADYIHNEGDIKVKCLNFSTWSNLGMSEGSSFGSVASQKGFIDISKQQGVLSIDLAIATTKPQLFIGLDANKPTIGHLLREGNSYMLTVYIQKKEAQNQFQGYLNEYIPIHVTYKIVKSINFLQDKSVSIEYFQDANGTFISSERNFTNTEEVLSKIWEELLKVSVATPESDFFELGGKSLSAIQLASQISEKFNIKFKLKHIIKHSKLSEMANQVGIESGNR